MMRDGENRKRQITVVDESFHSLPFSKGITANAIMASGLPPGPAYIVASEIEEYLIR